MPSRSSSAMAGMFRCAHVAIRSSGRVVPSRKLKAEREWSSMNIVPGWREVLFRYLFAYHLPSSGGLSRNHGGAMQASTFQPPGGGKTCAPGGFGARVPYWAHVKITIADLQQLDGSSFQPIPLIVLIVSADVHAQV